jgi:hypothetical protein
MFTFDSEEQVIAAGERIERARYYNRVRLIAKAAIEECPTDDSERDDYIWQDVDGDSYIIYTGKNLDVLRFTENDDAYEEAGSDFSDVTGAYAIYQRVAFYAMRQDVLDEVARLIEERDEEEEEVAQ